MKYAHCLAQTGSQHSTCLDGCFLESSVELEYGGDPKAECGDERAKGDLGKDDRPHPLPLHTLQRTQQGQRARDCADYRIHLLLCG